MSSASTVHARSRLMARVAALVASVTVLLFTTPAAASVAAPWCNDAAQSDIAPFPTLPTPNGELRAGAPCGGWDSSELGRTPSPERDQTSQAPTPECVPPVRAWALPPDRGRQLSRCALEWQFERPGFVHGVFRPPRTAR